MDSITSQITRYAAENPNGFAIISSSRVYTYAVLEKLSESLACYLNKQGILRNDRIVIVSDNNADFSLLTIALWKLGAVPVPLNTRLLPGEIESLIKFCAPKLVLIHSAFNAEIECQPGKIIFPVDHDPVNEVRNSSLFEPEDEAVIIFTSGSTGSPKGAVLTHKNLIESSLLSEPVLQLKPGEKFLLSLPVYHIGGFSIISRAFYFGAAVIIPDSNATEDIISAIQTLRPTHISLVPTQLKRLLDEEIKPNPELKNLLIGGGPSEDELLIAANKKKWKINKVYGSTETTAFITALEERDFERKYNSVGKPLNGVQIKIVKENKDDSLGEILIKSPSVFKEYLYNPEETQLKISDNFYHSGDLGYLDDEGFLYIETRRTDLIISGGENINPLEVEEQIRKHHDVIDVCVFGLKDDEWGQIAAAALVTNPEKQITESELKEFLKEKIASYKIPRKVFIEKELPVTSLGKVKRNEIREKYDK